jgi:cysteine synthase A
MIAAVRGYQCIIVMPEDMSAGRRDLLRSYGVEVLLTPVENGMRGAVDKANEILRKSSNAFMTRQFENPYNPEIHTHTTAEEIWQATDGKLEVFVTGVGTGGTLTGVAKVLKERNPALRVVAVEPKASPVLSGGRPGLHALQGLGAGFIPSVLKRELIDEIVTVSDLAAEKMAERLAKEEGMLVGISAGANVFAACQIAETLRPEERVLTILCDNGERYLN